MHRIAGLPSVSLLLYGKRIAGYTPYPPHPRRDRRREPVTMSRPGRGGGTVDAAVSKTAGGNSVRVRLPLPARQTSYTNCRQKPLGAAPVGLDSTSLYPYGTPTATGWEALQCPGDGEEARARFENDGRVCGRRG